MIDHYRTMRLIGANRKQVYIIFCLLMLILSDSVRKIDTFMVEMKYRNKEINI